MKHFITISFAFLLCFKLAKAQQTPTFAEPPGPEHVLVVYKQPVDENDTLGIVSEAVKDYYQFRRGIPQSNILDLENLINDDIYDPVSNTTHRIILDQQGEIIRDSINQNSLTPSIHAWLYFNERIAKPIANYLKTTVVNGDTLKNKIRFIVLCKGVPFRIDARKEDADSRGTNVICANLLTHLGETFEDPDALLFYYNKTPGISNPYYNVDPNFSMDHHFLPNHYQTIWQERIVPLSYLVTHLSAPRFEDIKGMIDKSLNAINVNDYDWFIDAQSSGFSANDASNTELVFNKLGINNYFFEYSNLRILTHNMPVMTYCSDGTWSGFPPDYIQSQLNFIYSPGAFFSTYESHNGLSIGTFPVIRTRGQGLIADFTLMGGTVGVGQALHSPGSSVIKNYIFFPSYALGYTFIEAAYLGLFNLDATNVVVGDPLTKLINYKTITVTSDTTITGGDFVGRIIVPEGKTLTIAGGLAFNLKRNSNIIVNGSLIIESNNTLILSGYSKINLTANGFLYVGDNAALVLNGNSLVNSKGEIAVGFNSSLSFFNNSKFISEGVLNILAGTEIIKKYNSELRFSGIFVSIGTANNRIIFNGSDSIADIIFDKIDSLKITNCSFINSVLNIHSSRNRIHFLEITDNNFHYTIDVIRPLIFLDIDKDLNDVDALISNNNFNNFSNVGINAVGVRNLTIDSCNFVSDAINGIAVKINEIKNLNIRNSYFNTLKGIYIIKNSDEALTVNRDQNITIKNCNFLCPITELPVYSVSFATANNDLSISSLKIENCSFTGYNECVYLLNLNNLNPLIRNNSFFDFKSFGINAANGNGIRIINNQFNSSSQISSLQKTGIFLSQISYPHIISNNLSLQQQNIPGAGISLISCNGEIRGNSISGFKYGIELGSSSPNIGANVLTSNTENGIYVGAYSNPNLSYTIINDDVYPVSGYNTIRENGLCNFFPSYSEIYLSNSNIQLKGGCNTIADDREDPALHCNYLYLIDGDHIEETIYAAENYWGEINNHNPEGRFGENITVEYEGYLNEPCNYSSGSEILLLTDQNGEVFDTVYSSMNNISQLSDLETRYSMANSYFYSKEFAQAKNKYENIIELYGTLRNSLKAYLRLYEIATITNSAPDEFNQLHQFYLLKASIQTDSVMIGVLKHLSSLCFVWSKNYEEALARFESDIQAASNDDIVLYRMIDILTTSLLIEPDTLVGKRAPGYLTTSKNSSYSEIISELLSTRGKSIENERIKIIPKEFSLYQNYPNPFNPGTTISFDLPKSTQVTLTIYDILGRNIKTIVDEPKEAGSYSINVYLGDLSSGVYFYHLKTEDFNATRKMVLLR